MTVGSEYRALATRFRSLPEQMVRAGALAMQREIEQQVRSDTGGDAVLSGTIRQRRRKTRLATRVTVNKGTALATATVRASPNSALGQWGWLERGTSSRDEPKLHMLINGAWRTGPWTTSGAPAKRTFTEGSERGTRPAEQAMTDEWERVT